MPAPQARTLLVPNTPCQLQTAWSARAAEPWRALLDPHRSHHYDAFVLGGFVGSFFVRACDKFHKVAVFPQYSVDRAGLERMSTGPIFLAAGVALAIALGMLIIGVLLGPRRDGAVKRMPYESGMDPIHNARRRFDVRFYLVAIAFLIFDVELLFLYPWAVASRHTAGIDRVVEAGGISGRGIVFGGVLFFLLLVIAGLFYEWRKGVLRWR